MYMKKQTLHKITKTGFVLLMVFIMGLGQALPIHAAERASVKAVSGVKFSKGKGANKKLNWCYGSVYTGDYIMYLKSNESGKDFLISTKDGKNYKKTDLTKLIQLAGNVGKKKAKEAYFTSASVVDDEAVLCGGFADESCFLIKTKDGANFFYQSMPECKELSQYSQLFKVGSKYVWIRTWDEGQDYIDEQMDGTVVAEFQYYVSETGEIWDSHYISLSGIKNADGMIEYDDAVKKENRHLLLSGVVSEGGYLYFNITYRPYSEGGMGDAHETYVYRTKDFETYEKVDIYDGMTNEVTEWEQSIAFDRKGSLYGTAAEWNVDTENWEYNVEGFVMAKAENESNFKQIFTYNPKDYNSNTTNCIYNWNEDGTWISVFMEREKETGLFVSETGNSSFKEYQTEIKPSKCSGIWEDAKNGYKIMGYDEMKYLLFSKNGFITSYKVELPDTTQGIAVKDDILSTTTEKGNYYVKLADLYKQFGK